MFLCSAIQPDRKLQAWTRTPVGPSLFLPLETFSNLLFLPNPIWDGPNVPRTKRTHACGVVPGSYSFSIVSGEQLWEDCSHKAIFLSWSGGGLCVWGMLTCKVLCLEPSRVQGSGQLTVKDFSPVCGSRLTLLITVLPLIPSTWGLGWVHHHCYDFVGSSSSVRHSSRKVSACLLQRHSWPSSLSNPCALFLLNDEVSYFS